ncbi:sensor histidine kinase [Pseudodesulfovibrio cashew]|uniref:Sensor histidine kinase n=1 Tax=Pseudodesulfovibrio cashew TaxID=2678688 RepID=A0A6I6JHA1_9BACT|nr:sensor histidine kinase [Pseudodesulfovibrio cashew]QGY40398.1 sensor histidine kinase [Pseudodesulfovibrio cashew]
MTTSASEAHQGLQFFGRISASVSHEIKNVFAVINESAGLIEDFTLMAERGMPIQPEKLKSVAASIQGQVRRGDSIVRNMNAFAHSADEPVREVNLAETLGLIVALTTRLADMKQVRLTLGDCESISRKANPFDLMRLLHGAMEACLDGLAPGDSLVACVKSADGGASFSLSAPGKDVPFASDASLSSLAQAMGLRIISEEGTGTLELLFPAA